MAAARPDDAGEEPAAERSGRSLAARAEGMRHTWWCSRERRLRRAAERHRMIFRHALFLAGCCANLGAAGGSARRAAGPPHSTGGFRVLAARALAEGMLGFSRQFLPGVLVALTPYQHLMAVCGVTIGILIGALPGSAASAWRCCCRSPSAWSRPRESSCWRRSTPAHVRRHHHRLPHQHAGESASWWTARGYRAAWGPPKALGIARSARHPHVGVCAHAVAVWRAGPFRSPAETIRADAARPHDRHAAHRDDPLNGLHSMTMG